MLLLCCLLFRLLVCMQRTYLCIHRTTLQPRRGEGINRELHGSIRAYVIVAQYACLWCVFTMHPVHNHICVYKLCVAAYLYKPAPVNRACRVNADGQSATCNCACMHPTIQIPLVVCQFAVFSACSEQCCALPCVPVCSMRLGDTCKQ